MSIAQQRPGPKPRQHDSSVSRSNVALSAQQRPGPKPRQHSCMAVAGESDDLRSTKAGTEAPATPGGDARDVRDAYIAQQRPGPKPRQHRATRDSPRRPKTAQQRPGPKPRQHSRIALDTENVLTAQQRPGPKPRQHRWVASLLPMDKGAQQRPGPKPRQHAAGQGAQLHAGPRSTKAGTEAPATHGRRVRHLPRGRPLNKGRDRSPGNTRDRPGSGLHHSTAQQRPGPKPRQHTTFPSSRTSNSRAQQRPGPKPRQHFGVVHWHNRRSAPAQQRPGPKPRQHADAGRGRRGSLGAQQRPGPKPRQHPPRARQRYRRNLRPLNKGRDRSPGNTPRHRPHEDLRPRRSTKAGTEAPATPGP